MTSRFRDRETTDQSARTAGDRLHRQPSPAARPTTQPRPDHRNRRPRRHHQHPHHHQRHPHPRTAVRRPTHPRTAIRTARVPLPPERIHQQRPAHPHRPAAWTRPLHRHRRADDLRPAPTLKTRALITRIEGTHRYLVTNHGLDTATFLTCVQPRIALRPRRTRHRDTHPGPSAIRCHRIPHRGRNLTTAA